MIRSYLVDVKQGKYNRGVNYLFHYTIFVPRTTIQCFVVRVMALADLRLQGIPRNGREKKPRWDRERTRGREGTKKTSRQARPGKEKSKCIHTILWRINGEWITKVQEYKVRYQKRGKRECLPNPALHSARYAQLLVIRVVVTLRENCGASACPWAMSCHVEFPLVYIGKWPLSLVLILLAFALSPLYLLSLSDWSAEMNHAKNRIRKAIRPLWGNTPTTLSIVYTHVNCSMFYRAKFSRANAN